MTEPAVGMVLGELSSAFLFSNLRFVWGILFHARFMEDGDMQQMRTRRRFQTGLIILFLLFFMDTRRTSTGQRRASGHRQVLFAAYAMLPRAFRQCALNRGLYVVCLILLDIVVYGNCRLECFACWSDSHSGVAFSCTCSLPWIVCTCREQRATDSKDVYATVKKMGPDFDDPGREAFQFEASYFEGAP